MNPTTIHMGATVFVMNKNTQQVESHTLSEMDDFMLTLSNGTQYVHCRNALFELGMPLNKNDGILYASLKDREAHTVWNQICDHFGADTDSFPRYLNRQLIQAICPEFEMQDSYHIKPIKKGSQLFYVPLWGKIGGKRMCEVKSIRNKNLELNNGVKFDLNQPNPYCMGKSTQNTPEPLRGFLYQSEADYLEYRKWEELTNMLFMGDYTYLKRNQVDEVCQVMINFMDAKVAAGLGIHKEDLIAI